MTIYLENNSAKFHPHPIWNCGALWFIGRSRSTTRTTTLWAAIWDQFL